MRRAGLVAFVALGCVDGLTPTSSMRVATVTAGEGTDEDGYTLMVDADVREPIGIRDTILVSGLSPGEHTVRLERVDPNCAVADGDQREVTLGEVVDTTVRFVVTCAEGRGALQISTFTRGQDLDGSGYVVSLAGRTVALEDSVAVSITLAAGTYEVLLEGIATNCTVNDPNPRSAAVPRGGFAAVRFELDCTATQPAGRGREIAFVRRVPNEEDSFFTDGRLFLMNDDGTSVRQLPPVSGTSQNTPEWLADGMHLGSLVSEHFCEKSCDVPYLLDVVSGISQPLATGPRELGGNARWSPDGSHLAFGSVDCEEECIESINVVSADQQDFSGFASESLGYSSPDWLPDGDHLAFVRSGEGLLDVAIRMLGDSTDTPASPNLSRRFSTIRDLAVSPDGQQIAFAAEPLEPDGTSQLYVLPGGGAGPEQLTDTRSENSQPSWSPDGTRLAFVSDLDGDRNIYVIDLRTKEITGVTRDPQPEDSPTWRP